MVRRSPEHVGHYSHSDPSVTEQGSGRGDLCGTQLPAAGPGCARSSTQLSPHCLPGIQIKLDLLDENVTCLIECIAIFADNLFHC